MNWDEFKHHVQEISKYEFLDRDIQLQKVVVQIMAEMSARGLLTSTIALHKFAEFFGEEFKYRCNYLTDLIIGSISKISIFEKEDQIGKAKIFFQELSAVEKDKLVTKHKESTSKISQNLLSKMPEQIEKLMEGIFDHVLHKNNAIIEFDFRSIITKLDKKQIVILQPNFMGAGIDVRALWERMKN